MNSQETQKTDCPICLEHTDDTLECGHKIHLECVKKHFKPECPVCRKPLNITVSGKLENNDEELNAELIRTILERDEAVLSSQQLLNEFLQQHLYEMLYMLSDANNHNF